MTTKATPLDMPQMTPWWPCRPIASQLETYAILGYRGLFFPDGRRYVDRGKRAPMSRDLRGRNS